MAVLRNTYCSSTIDHTSQVSIVVSLTESLRLCCCSPFFLSRSAGTGVRLDVLTGHSSWSLANAAGSSTEVIFDGSHSCRSNVASDEPTNCHLLEYEHQVLTHRPAESALNFARWDEITATGVVGTVRQGFAFCLNKARRGPASSQVLAVEIGSRFGFGNSL